MKENKFAKKNAKALAKIATGVLKVEANSSSCILVYQPKAPKELARFKK